MDVTLKDIAEKAGVSISTVSRVINDDKERPASEKTKEKVWKLVKEMGYTRTKKKAIMSEGKKKIGIIANVSADDEIDNPFTSVIMDGIKSEINTNGYSIGFNYTRNDLDNKSSIYKLMNDEYAEGLIILGVYFEEKFLKQLHGRFNNLILIKNIYNEIESDRIIVDKRKAVSQAVNYLIKLNHKKIAFLCGMQKGKIFSTIKDGEKYKGYKDAMETASISINENYVRYSGYSLDGGYSEMKKLLQLEDKPTAVFTGSDLIAIGAIRAIQEKDLDIPGDISIISYDNIEMSKYTTPPLSTIHIPKKEMGEMAVRILLQRIRGELTLPLKIVLPTNLVIRKTAAELKK